jgi:peptidoglycan/LPS O-acetylase OafA/YrhL
MDAPPADRRSHLDFLDGIRGLAALYVLAHHSWFELYPDAMNHPAPGATARLATPLAFGHWAVAVFIILSGFCLTLPVSADHTLRGGPLQFFWRRARRILPPYYAALVVSLVLIHFLIGSINGSHWDVALGIRRPDLAAALLLIGDALGSYKVNHAFWSVQLEWKIYFLFPLLLWAARRIGIWAATAVTVVVAFGVAQLVAGVKLDLGHVVLTPRGLTIQFVGLFALGMLAADVSRRPRRLPTWAGPATVSAAAIAIAVLVRRWGMIESMRHDRALDAAVGLIVAPTLAMLARNPTARVARLLAARPLVWLGGISYSFYLLHAPLVQVAFRYVVRPLHLPPPLRLPVLIVTALGLTLAAAVPFFLAIERPCMSRRLRATQPAAAAVTPAPPG